MDAEMHRERMRVCLYRVNVVRFVENDNIALQMQAQLKYSQHIGAKIQLVFLAIHHCLCENLYQIALKELFANRRLQ